MANTFDEVKNVAMTLNSDDRARLAEVLWESLNPVSPQGSEPLSPEWAAEVERRIRDVRSGKEPRFTLEQVQAEIQKIIDS